MFATKYEFLNTLNDLNNNGVSFAFADEIKQRLNKDIDSDMIISLQHSSEITYTSKMINQTTIASAYKILPKGVDYIENFEFNKRTERTNKITLIVSVATLIISLIGAIISILAFAL